MTTSFQPAELIGSLCRKQVEFIVVSNTALAGRDLGGNDTQDFILGYLTLSLRDSLGALMDHALSLRDSLGALMDHALSLRDSLGRNH